jgi:catechol 2,3-dioxygenase-like lactoylglutathione lyase family enzyme
MLFDHYAIFSDSEEESDRFYIELLGMEKKYKFKVQADLIYKIFGFKEEFEVIRYGKNGVDIEVFITDNMENKDKDKIGHLGIKMDNRDAIFNKAKKMGYSATKIEKSDSKSYNLFIKDGSGNYFEIKEEEF